MKRYQKTKECKNKKRHNEIGTDPSRERLLKNSEGFANGVSVLHFWYCSTHLLLVKLDTRKAYATATAKKAKIL